MESTKGGFDKMEPDKRKEAQRKGGLTRSKNLKAMQEMGRKGGLTTSQNREHMAEIGRKGGLIKKQKYEQRNAERV